MNRRSFLVLGASAFGVSFRPRESCAAATPALTVETLATNIWRHTSWKVLANGAAFPSSGLIVAGGDRVLILDTTWPTEDMDGLLDRAQQIASGRSIQLVCTHAHDDRMSGVSIARARGVRSLAHVLSQEDAPARRLPIADEAWAGETLLLDLGGRAVELFYPGPAHTRDNVVAFIADAGMLFGGCIIRTARIGIGNTADANRMEYATSVQKLIDRYGSRSTIVVPGHDVPGGPELLAATLKMARTLQKS